MNNETYTLSDEGFLIFIHFIHIFRVKERAVIPKKSLYFDCCVTWVTGTLLLRSPLDTSQKYMKIKSLK